MIKVDAAETDKSSFLLHTIVEIWGVDYMQYNSSSGVRAGVRTLAQSGIYTSGAKRLCDHSAQTPKIDQTSLNSLVNMLFSRLFNPNT